MTSNADHNLEMIECVAEGLGEELRNEVAFVGGCTTAMLVTDNTVSTTSGSRKTSIWLLSLQE